MLIGNSTPGRSAFQNLAIGHMDSAVGPPGKIFVMRNDQDRLLFFLGQLFEQSEDGRAVGAI
ncbi:hypothetical protein D3C87_2163000 [compost metagenome]